MLQNEMELDEKKKQMVAMLKTQAKVDNRQKQERWTNYYGEKEPLPEL